MACVLVKISLYFLYWTRLSHCFGNIFKIKGTLENCRKNVNKHAFNNSPLKGIHALILLDIFKSIPYPEDMYQEEAAV